MNLAIVPGTAFAVVMATLQPLSAQSSRGDAASGQLYAIKWCTECHSVEPESAGTGRFAPDFTAIAKSPSTTGFSLERFLAPNISACRALR